MSLRASGKEGRIRPAEHLSPRKSVKRARGRSPHRMQGFGEHRRSVLGAGFASRSFLAGLTPLRLLRSGPRGPPDAVSDPIALLPRIARQLLIPVRESVSEKPGSGLCFLSVCFFSTIDFVSAFSG